MSLSKLEKIILKNLYYKIGYDECINTFRRMPEEFKSSAIDYEFYINVYHQNHLMKRDKKRKIKKLKVRI